MLGDWQAAGEILLHIRGQSYLADDKALHSMVIRVEDIVALM